MWPRCVCSPESKVPIHAVCCFCQCTRLPISEPSLRRRKRETGTISGLSLLEPSLWNLIGLIPARTLLRTIARPVFGGSSRVALPDHCRSSQTLKPQSSMDKISVRRHFATRLLPNTAPGTVHETRQSPRHVTGCDLVSPCFASAVLDTAPPRGLVSDISLRTPASQLPGRRGRWGVCVCRVKLRAFKRGCSASARPEGMAGPALRNRTTHHKSEKKKANGR